MHLTMNFLGTFSISVTVVPTAKCLYTRHTSPTGGYSPPKHFTGGDHHAIRYLLRTTQTLPAIESGQINNATSHIHKRR